MQVTTATRWEPPSEAEEGEQKEKYLDYTGRQGNRQQQSTWELFDSLGRGMLPSHWKRGSQKMPHFITIKTVNPISSHAKIKAFHYTDSPSPQSHTLPEKTVKYGTGEKHLV